MKLERQVNKMTEEIYWIFAVITIVNLLCSWKINSKFAKLILGSFCLLVSGLMFQYNNILLYPYIQILIFVLNLFILIYGVDKKR